MKNNKVVSLILALVLMMSIFGISAYGNTITDYPTLKNDGINGSLMKPDSPAFETKHRKIGSMWEEAITGLPTLRDDDIDGSLMKPDSPAFETENRKIGSMWEETGEETDNELFLNKTYNVTVPKNVTGSEGLRLVSFNLNEDEDTVKVTFVSSINEDDMDQINVSLINYSSGDVIDWYPGLKVTDYYEFEIPGPSYTDYYAVYVSTNQISTIGKIKVETK